MIHLLSSMSQSEGTFQGTLFYHYMWISPLEVAVIMLLLYYEVGLSFLPGLGFILLLMPLQAWLSKIFGRLRYIVFYTSLAGDSLLSSVRTDLVVVED